MKYIILLCCLVCGFKSYSQSTENPIDVLQEFFADKLPLTYSETIHPYDLKYLKRALVNDTLYNGFLLGQKNDGKQLILTLGEKKYLLEKIDEQQGFIWPKNLFNNCEKTNLEEKNSTSKSKTRVQTICNFTKPIFIRKNSICIFYYGYYCGGECGKGSVEIYRKIGDKWTSWISMVQWIS